MIYFNKNMMIRILTLMVAMVSLTGCGVKRPPKPLGIPEPPSVGDLVHEISAETVRLGWSVPEGDARVMNSARAFIVYRAENPVTAERCEGCPVLFKRIAEVDLTSKGDDGRMSYIDDIGHGYRYVYKVALFFAGGRIGPDSNHVEFDFK